MSCSGPFSDGGDASIAVLRRLGDIATQDPAARTCLEELLRNIVGGGTTGNRFLHADQCLCWGCGYAVIYVVRGRSVRFTELYRAREPLEELL